jgi:hypothetical protein
MICKEAKAKHATKLAPFTVVIDSAETIPFDFTGNPIDNDSKGRLWEVPVVWRSLGRHPKSYGDYSLAGFERMVAIERKSINDLCSTVLGFGQGGRRERFESELANLATIKCPLVIVEGTLAATIDGAPDTPNRTSTQNGKSVNRSVISYLQDYRVPFLFCDTRELAQREAFLFLHRFWKQHQELERLVSKL